MIGRSLGHYRIQQQIGAGGMGVVYRARDEHLERDVALKVLPPGALTDEAARRRFRKEALALSQLNHPNIATVHDFDTAEGIDFLVMELIPGETLAERLAAGPLEEKEISRLGAQVTEGLAAAHEHGVVHRDLKPGNLRITRDGRLKILDFGLATLRRPKGDAAATVTATETLAMAGTLPYMAPEQLRGSMADARSDIYGAGVVLYEMATGRRPFAEAQGPQLVSAILEQSPPAPGTVNKGISPGLENIILKALDKEPNRRYQSARELGVDLERLTEPVMAAAPRPRRRGWMLAAAVLAAVLVLLYVFRSGRGPFESIAVLPFVNASGSAEADHLGDGIAESLITSLSQLPNLKVISRTSAFRYKGQEIDPQLVGRDLRVDAVLTGQVVQRGDSLVVTAELVDARDRSRIWGQKYNRKLADILAIQAELGREISEGLRLRLTGQQRKALARRHTQDPEAYQEYLKGLFFWNKRTPAGTQAAIDHFNRAIARDSSYALAYAGLAESYVTWLGNMPPREFMPKLHAAATKALEIDDTLGEAHIALAYYRAVYEWDWAGAERECRHGIDLSPAYAIGHYRYAQYLTALERFDEALAAVKRALDLDPVSLTINFNLGLVHCFARRYDEAMDQFRRTAAMDPNYGFARWGVGAVYMERSMYPEAIAEFTEAVRLMPGSAQPLGSLSFAYALSGDQAAARRVLEQILAARTSRGYASAMHVALGHLGLGDKDRAFEWLRRAVEERDTALFWFKPTPPFRSLRSDARYTELLRRMNLPLD